MPTHYQIKICPCACHLVSVTQARENMQHTTLGVLIGVPAAAAGQVLLQ